MFLLQAALVKAVQDVRDGRVDLNFSQTVQAALPYLLPVAAAGILAAIGITIGFFLIIVPGLILLDVLVPHRALHRDRGVAARSTRSARAGGPYAATPGTCSAP